MDFSRLPDDPFLKIFKYLSFEECIRAGGVNRSFHRISQLVTSRTKSLDLGQARFPKLRPDQLAVILDLCSPNLEKISLDFYSDDVNGIRLATKMASYHCPRLTYIYFGDAPMGNPVFQQLIRNAPNLEILITDADYLVFPDDVMNNKLKMLKFGGDVDEDTFRSLIGRCPNVTELEIGVDEVTANVLDEFLASVPQVDRILFRQEIESDILEDIVNLWQLTLVSLEIENKEGTAPGDEFMFKVASSFPHLQRFSMGSSMATDDAVKALANLQELEFLDVNFDAASYYGILELAKCKKLRRLNICSSEITGGTLITLLRGCPQLEYIGICEIFEADTPGEAAALLESLSGIPKRDITILMYSVYGIVEYELKSIWESKDVKKAMRKLEKTDGLKIKIEWRLKQTVTDSDEDMEEDDEDWVELMDDE